MALNIFEPRYRLMVRRCMEGNRRFGMAVMEHSHVLHGVACEAEIVECQPQPDGYATHLWPPSPAQHLPYGAEDKGGGQGQAVCRLQKQHSTAKAGVLGIGIISCPQDWTPGRDLWVGRAAICMQSLSACVATP